MGGAQEHMQLTDIQIQQSCRLGASAPAVRLRKESQGVRLVSTASGREAVAWGLPAADNTPTTYLCYISFCTYGTFIKTDKGYKNRRSGLQQPHVFIPQAVSKDVLTIEIAEIWSAERGQPEQGTSEEDQET